MVTDASWAPTTTACGGCPLCYSFIRVSLTCVGHCPTGITRIITKTPTVKICTVEMYGWLTSGMVGENTFDKIAETLADVHRRKALIKLLESETVRLNTQDGTSSPPDGRVSPIQMHHVHLPKLDDHGFIDWDTDTGEVTRGPSFEEVRPVLEVLHDRRDALPADYLPTRGRASD